MQDPPGLPAAPFVREALVLGVDRRTGARRGSRGWPSLGTVEDPQHQHDGPLDPVHHDVWRSDDHEFPRGGNAAETSDRGMIGQLPHGGMDSITDVDSRPRITLGDPLELRDQVAGGLRGATRSSRETPGRLPFKGRALLLPAGAHRLVSQTSQGRVVGFAERVFDLAAEPAVVLPELTVAVHGVCHQHTQQLSCCPFVCRCHLGEGGLELGIDPEREGALGHEPLPCVTRFVLMIGGCTSEDGSRLARETKRRRPTCGLLWSHAV